MDDLENKTSFSTAFQSYQDNGPVIMKGCVQWNPIYDRKNLSHAELEPRTARSVSQRINKSGAGIA